MSERGCEDCFGEGEYFYGGPGLGDAFFYAQGSWLCGPCCVQRDLERCVASGHERNDCIECDAAADELRELREELPHLELGEAGA